MCRKDLSLNSPKTFDALYSWRRIYYRMHINGGTLS